jgi:TRAP transporter 4TM/12TM fusion protein
MPPTSAADVLSREFGSRRLVGLAAWVAPALAGSWSLFQLAIAKQVLLPSEWVRCVHLAFALALVYLCFPARRGSGSRRFPRWDWLTATNRIPIPDALLATVAAAAAMYLAVDYAGIGSRLGTPLPRDLAVGVVLVVVLLEAARRALGPALPIIAGGFIAYSFFSESMPTLLAFKNASLAKVVNKLALTTEGIYGVPLDVSANVVFLFVLFGAMLEKAGGGKYFIDLAFSLLGGFRGGPAKAAVLASGLTGMVNGSSIANTVTTGTFTIPLMKRAGYPAVKAGAIEVAASTNGQLMPPIMGAAAFIIAEYCNMSYLAVVRAALVPALISYIALLYITHLEALKLNLQPVPRRDLPPFFKTFREGIHFLIPLTFLIYQLVIERRSAQRSAYAAILALAVLMVARHVWVGWRDGVAARLIVGRVVAEVWASLVAGGRNMMSIGVAVAAAGIIVGIVTLGLGGVITEVIAVASGGRLVSMLLITAVVSLILGMGLPTTANYIVMATLTAPAILVLAHDAGLAVPMVAAHLFCFYFGILSDDTPPVGLAAYAAAAISGADPIRTGIQGFLYDIRTAILPFMFIFNTDLLLIGIHSPWRIGAVFVTGAVAMCAFASLVQHHALVRNRIHESLLLLAAVLVLLRHDLVERALHITPWTCYLLGICLFATVYALQWPRRQTAP